MAGRRRHQPGQIWTTLHAILHNPAVAARMIATLDHISGGRAGLNVASAYRGEFSRWAPGMQASTMTHAMI